MTADELATYFNDTFDLGEWPRTFVVDAETYANCCQKVFDYVNETLGAQVYLGVENNGLIFKNIELILKPK